MELGHDRRAPVVAVFAEGVEDEAGDGGEVGERDDGGGGGG